MKKNLKQATKVLSLIKLGLKTSLEKKTLTVFFNHDGGCCFVTMTTKKIAMSYRSDVKLVEVFHEDLLSYLWIRDYNAGVKTLEKSGKKRCIIEFRFFSNAFRINNRKNLSFVREK